MDPRYKSPEAEVSTPDDSGFRDLTGITSALQWMLRIGAVLIVASFFSSLMQLELLSRDFTPEEGTTNDMREGAVGGVEFLLLIATVIVFGRWIVLAHRNLVPLGAAYLEYRPGWAVGWFFIPIANLFKPYQAMKALWQNSHTVVKPDTQDSTWLLPTWWTLWLISSFLGNIILRMAIGADTIEELKALTEFGMFTVAVDLPLYFVSDLLVGRTWRAQQIQKDNPGEFRPTPGFADSSPSS